MCEKGLEWTQVLALPTRMVSTFPLFCLECGVDGPVSGSAGQSMVTGKGSGSQSDHPC